MVQIRITSVIVLVLDRHVKVYFSQRRHRRTDLSRILSVTFLSEFLLFSHDLFKQLF